MLWAEQGLAGAGQADGPAPSMAKKILLPGREKGLKQEASHHKKCICLDVNSCTGNLGARLIFWSSGFAQNTGRQWESRTGK